MENSNSAPIPSQITPQNISFVEDLAVKKVESTLSILEDSISVWEKTRSPRALSSKFTFYKKLAVRLDSWQKNLEKLRRTQHPDFSKRLSHLEELALICGG